MSASAAMRGESLPPGRRSARRTAEGHRIEWRLARGPGRQGLPFATIMRWTTAVVADDPKVDGGVHRGEVLVVTRLGPGGVCHVGYVDGRQNPNANALARAIADRACARFPVRQGQADRARRTRGRASADLMAGTIRRSRFGLDAIRLARRLSSRRRRPCRASCRRISPTSARPRGRRAPGRTRPPARCRTAPTPRGSSCRSARGRAAPP